MALIRCEITAGPRSGFKSVGISGAHGQMEFIAIEDRFLVPRNDTSLLPVHIISEDRRNKQLLVQLPVEADSGANRVWIKKDQLVEDAEEIPA